MKKHDRLLAIITPIAILILFAANLIQIKAYEQSYENHNNMILKQYEEQLKIAINAYQFSSDIFYNQNINIPEVTKYLSQAKKASLEEQKVLRAALYDEMKQPFVFMEQEGYIQLQFHLSESTSFLRMNYSEHFGENVALTCKMISDANTLLIPIQGFKEGKVTNGYRYLYPLYYEDDHVGSVILSVSVAAIINLEKEFFNNQASFIIRKKDIELSSQELEESNVIASNISDDYMYDVDVYNTLNDSMSDEEKILIDKINNQLFTEQIILKEVTTAFYTEHIIKNKTYITYFLPVNKYTDEQVGYILFYDVNTFNDTNLLNQILMLVMINFVFILGFILIVYFHRSRKKFYTLSKKDQLTGCTNRYAIGDIFDIEYKRYLRFGNGFSLVMFDLDYFKKVNDKYGHAIGDIVLITIVKLVKQNIREIDSLIRWGGEEFIIILPETPKNQAIECCEKLRKIIEEYKWELEDIKTITVSFGIASITKKDTLDTLIVRADKKMYIAKQKGRNRVEY